MKETTTEAAKSLCSNFSKRLKKKTLDGKLGVFHQTLRVQKAPLTFMCLGTCSVQGILGIKRQRNHFFFGKENVIIDLGNLERFTSHTWEINLEAAALTLWLHGGWLVSPVATRVSIFTF